MKGFTKKGKFHPIKKSKGVTRSKRYARRTSLSTSLGQILVPPKKSPQLLAKMIKEDLKFRDELIDKNKEIRVEIKSDPQGDFVESDRKEFMENSKEINALSKEIRSAVKDIPKDSRERLIDRQTQNQIRVLR